MNFKEIITMAKEWRNEITNCPAKLIWHPQHRKNARLTWKALLTILLLSFGVSSYLHPAIIASAYMGLFDAIKNANPVKIFLDEDAGEGSGGAAGSVPLLVNRKSVSYLALQRLDVVPINELQDLFLGEADNESAYMPLWKFLAAEKDGKGNLLKNFATQSVIDLVEAISGADSCKNGEKARETSIDIIVTLMLGTNTIDKIKMIDDAGLRKVLKEGLSSMNYYFVKSRPLPAVEDAAIMAWLFERYNISGEASNLGWNCASYTKATGQACAIDLRQQAKERQQQRSFEDMISGLIGAIRNVPEVRNANFWVVCSLSEKLLISLRSLMRSNQKRISKKKL
jgi:hypothetical protein